MFRTVFFQLRTKSVLFNQVKTLTYQRLVRRLYNDGIDLKQQSVEINPTERIRRCAFYKDVDLYTFYKSTCPNVRTLGDALHEGYIASNDGPCVGVFQSTSDNKVKSLTWYSYSKAMEQSQRVGSYFWTKLGLMPMQSKVAILSANRPEYLFVEQGCYQYGFVVVSLYTTYDAPTISNVLRRTRPEVLVVDNLQRIETILNELSNYDHLKEIVVLDDVKSDQRNKIQSLSSIFQTIQAGDVRQRPKVDPDSVATYILTSGTTGMNQSVFMFRLSHLLVF